MARDAGIVFLLKTVKAPKNWNTSIHIIVMASAVIAREDFKMSSEEKPCEVEEIGTMIAGGHRDDVGYTDHNTLIGALPI